MTPRHSERGGVAGRTTRSPLRHAPAPRSATYAVLCCGCQIQPRTASPPLTSPTITAWSRDPWTKFLVPSTGSTVNAWSAAQNSLHQARVCPAYVSSPRIIASGYAACSAAVISTSASRSADRDQVAGALLVDLAGRQRPEPRVDDLLGDVLQQPQHGVGVHVATVGVRCVRNARTEPDKRQSVAE